MTRFLAVFFPHRFRRRGLLFAHSFAHEPSLIEH